MYPSGEFSDSQDTQGVIFDHSAVRESSNQLSSGVGMVLPSVGVVGSGIVSSTASTMIVNVLGYRPQLFL